jgi:hypothetical protein
MKRPSKLQAESLAEYRYRQHELLRVAKAGMLRTPEAARFLLTYDDADLGRLFRCGLECAALGPVELEVRLD